MGSTTKIDWADATWNPVTGCLHGCEYCYARGIAERFNGHFGPGMNEKFPVFDQPVREKWRDEETGEIIIGKKEPYPYGFYPTFHRYKLDEPRSWKKPRTIFVGSMCDLFGEWVPDEWIREVFKVCEAAPQHRYLFLSKNPSRYLEYANKHPLTPPDRENFWYGTTITSEDDSVRIYDLLNWHSHNGANTYVSIEPLLDRLWQNTRQHIAETQWVIIGAETGNRKDRVTPEREWVNHIVNMCAQYNTPVFMKESLRGLMDDDFRQEFPWEA